MHTYVHKKKPKEKSQRKTIKYNLIIIIIINREVTANRSDIIIKNKKGKTRTLIDVAIPADRNIVQKEAEKKLKYKSL